MAIDVRAVFFRNRCCTDTITLLVKLYHRSELSMMEVDIANWMCGVQVVGREMLIHLVGHLLTGYKTDPLIAAVLSSTLIHILFTMNPDGFAVADRHSRGDCGGNIGR